MGGAPHKYSYMFRKYHNKIKVILIVKDQKTKQKRHRKISEQLNKFHIIKSWRMSARTVAVGGATEPARQLLRSVRNSKHNRNLPSCTAAQKASDGYFNLT